MGAYLTEQVSAVGLLAPIDKTGGTYAGTGIHMGNYQRVVFLVYFGNEATIDTLTLVVKGNSAATAGGTAIAARYKKASTGTAVLSVLDATSYTTLASSGLAIADGTDNMLYAVEVLASDLGTYGPYVNLSWGSPGAHACLISVIALGYTSRFNQLVPPDPSA